MKPLRIGIVNDSAVEIEVIRRVILMAPEHDISWTAHDGGEAVSFCAGDIPDLILMDIAMPVMGGVEATCTIMRETPCAILIVTKDLGSNASLIFEAMGCGALDAVGMPYFGDDGSITGADELLKKIATINKIVCGNRRGGRSHRKRSSVGKEAPLLVAIGSSTGGPKILVSIISRLPSQIETPIVIVQHVDAHFTRSLAEWLDEQTPLTVTIARENDYPRKGMVYLAETNDHLVMSPDFTFHYTPDPVDYPFRPSVDSFFNSLVANWPTKGTAILLSGMGKDGASGLLALRKAGWKTVAQDKESSVVFGMPKAAIEIEAAEEVLSPHEIAELLSTF